MQVMGGMQVQQNRAGPGNAGLPSQQQQTPLDLKIEPHGQQQQQKQLEQFRQPFGFAPNGSQQNQPGGQAAMGSGPDAQLGFSQANQQQQN